MTITDQHQKLFSDLQQHTPEIIADGVPDELPWLQLENDCWMRLEK